MDNNCVHRKPSIPRERENATSKKQPLSLRKRISSDRSNRFRWSNVPKTDKK